MALLLAAVDEIEAALGELVTDGTFKALYKRPVSIEQAPQFPYLWVRMRTNPYGGRGTGHDQWNMAVVFQVVIVAQQTGSNSHMRALAVLVEAVRAKIRSHLGSATTSGLNLDDMDIQQDPEISDLADNFLVAAIDVVYSGVDKF